MRVISLAVPIAVAFSLAYTTIAAAEQSGTSKYHVAGAGEKAIMVDTFTGRSWELDFGLADDGAKALVDAGELDRLQPFWRQLRFLEERSTEPALRETPP